MEKLRIWACREPQNTKNEENWKIEAKTLNDRPQARKPY